MQVTIRLIRTTNFSARLIHLGMWLWAVLRFKKPKKIYNHFEIGYDGLMSSGAVADGVENRLFADYLKEHDVEDYVEYPISLSDDKYKVALEYIRRSEGIKYEYSNFLWHTVKIFTGLWLGNKTNRKLFCYEYGIRFLNYVKSYGLDPYMNPYEFKDWADSNLK